MNRKSLTSLLITLTLVGSAVLTTLHAAGARVGGGDPHTCIAGFVWREAFPGDDVCVVPAIRAQAAADNAQAANRFARNHLAYGPDTCVDGHVWRQTVPSDHVCVLPRIRTLTAYENSVAPSRWAH
jgi:hypothetical protein